MSRYRVLSVVVWDRWIVVLAKRCEIDQWYGTLMGTWPSGGAKSTMTFDLGWPVWGRFKVTNVKVVCGVSPWEMDPHACYIGHLNSMTLQTSKKFDLAPCTDHPSNSWASVTFLSRYGDFSVGVLPSISHRLATIHECYVTDDKRRNYTACYTR